VIPVVLGAAAAPEGITLSAAQVGHRDDTGVLIIIFRIEFIAAAPLWIIG
jgi:hypothetical protein